MSSISRLAALTFVALLGGCDRAAATPDASARDVSTTRDASPVADSSADLDASADAVVFDASDASVGYERPTLVTVPALARPDFSMFPRDDAGRPVLISVPGAELRVDESLRDPMFTLATCGALIAGCVSPGRSLDACVVSAPTCATSAPWTEASLCCPSACRDRFESARAAGTSDFDAFKRVYFDEPGCFPGVLDMLGVRP